VGLFSIALFNNQEKIVTTFYPKINKIQLNKLTNSLSIPNFTQNQTKNIYKKTIPTYLENHLNNNDKILCVGNNNIYNFYFKLIPIKNTLLYWHNDVTFNKSSTNLEYFKAYNIFKHPLTGDEIPQEVFKLCDDKDLLEERKSKTISQKAFDVFQNFSKISLFGI
jgi:hypothetical protein